jgi:HK97 family phage major capsid protein
MAPRVTIPTSPVELESMLNDASRMKEVLGDPESMQAFFRTYASKVMGETTDLAQQVKECVQAEISDWLRSNGQEHINRANLVPGSYWDSAKKCAQYNRRAPGVVLDDKFTDAVDFYRAIWHLNTSQDNVNRLADIRNSFGSNIPSSGGLLVPEALRATLMMRALENAIVRPRALVVPMETARVSLPTVDDTTHAGSVMGGMVAYWTEEAGDLTDTSAKFGTVTLDAKNLTMYTEVPNNLLADSPAALGAFIDTQFPRAIGHFEDLAFLTGVGGKQPLGILKSGAMVSVSKKSGQAADTIVWENIVAMFARLFPASIGNSIWVANINTFVELATMAQSVGVGGSIVWLGNGRDEPPMTILGRPVIFTEKVPTLGDAGDISLIDPSYYGIGDRQTLEAMASPHYKFANVKTAYRFVERVDGHPLLMSAITPANGTDKLSAFVQMEARA